MYVYIGRYRERYSDRSEEEAVRAALRCKEYTDRSRDLQVEGGGYAFSTHVFREVAVNSVLCRLRVERHWRSDERCELLSSRMCPPFSKKKQTKRTPKRHYLCERMNEWVNEYGFRPWFNAHIVVEDLSNNKAAASSWFSDLVFAGCFRMMRQS